MIDKDKDFARAFERLSDEVLLVDIDAGAELARTLALLSTLAASDRTAHAQDA